MRLLLTRAAEDAARTRAKLEAMGHAVVVSPVIEFIGTGAVWPMGVIDAVLATSAQAFKAELAGPLPEARRLMPLYLVGSRTAEAARDGGFLGAVTGEKNALSLAAALERLQDHPRRIVYLAGQDRKPELEAALTAMGQVFEVVVVYAACEVVEPSAEAVKEFEQAGIDGVLHFSRRSAGLFLAAMEKAGLNAGRPTHFCLSEDVATPLREAGLPNLAIAAEPYEADLLELVGRM